MSAQLSKRVSQYIAWNSPIGWSVALVAAVGTVMWPAGSTWLWVAFFLIAAMLCGSSYLERCGRVHCRITGPFFLLCAVYLTIVQLGMVPFMGNAWFLVAVMGTIAVTFLAELLFGPYTGR